MLATSGEMTTAAALLCGGIVLGTPTGLRMIFQLRVRNDIPILFVTLNSLLWTGAVVTIAALDGGLVAFAAAMVIASSVTTAWQGGRGRPRVAHARHPPDRRPRAGAGAAATGPASRLAGLLTLAYTRIDHFFVFEYAGASRRRRLRRGVPPARPGPVHSTAS